MRNEAINPIKEKILLKLLMAENGLRYSEAKLDRIENDLYNYHLQSLVKSNLVEKEESAYKLTNKGVTYCASHIHLSPTGRVEVNSRQNSICIVYDNSNSQNIKVLNQVRRLHPNYGEVGVMGGRILNGEPVLEAANRKLEEETGLSADFNYGGCFRGIAYYAKDKIAEDILFHCCYSNKFSGVLKKKTSFGDNKWVDIDTAIKNEYIRKSSSKITPLSYFLKQIKEGSKNPYIAFVEVYRRYYGELVKNGIDKTEASN